METKMPTQDISFQPQTPSYTFTAKKEQGKKGRIKKLSLLIGIFFLLISIGVSFFTFFYLNSQSNSNKNRIPDNFINYTTLSNQAGQNKMTEYINKVITKNIPADNKTSPTEFYGILSGFDKNNLQVVTNTGIKNIPLSKDLFVLRMTSNDPEASEQASTSAIISNNTQGETLNVAEINKQELFNTEQFGITIQIVLTSDLKSVHSIFLNN